MSNNNDENEGNVDNGPMSPDSEYDDYLGVYDSFEVYANDLENTGEDQRQRDEMQLDNRGEKLLSLTSKIYR